ncbi:MAG: hypothetical protein AAB365_01400 [Patescibacteria group bacterium]
MKNNQKGLFIALIIIVAIGSYVMGKKGASVSPETSGVSSTTSTTSTTKTPVPSQTGTAKPAASPAPVVKPVSTANDHIRLISPNGGEVFEAGKQYKITWVDSRDLSNVRIYAANVETGGVGKIIAEVSVRASGIDGVASHMWTASEVPTGTYKMNVCNTETLKCDMSNGSFTIVQ